MVCSVASDEPETHSETFSWFGPVEVSVLQKPVSKLAVQPVVVQKVYVAVRLVSRGQFIGSELSKPILVSVSKMLSSVAETVLSIVKS